jgi:hypothetical protein
MLGLLLGAATAIVAVGTAGASSKQAGKTALDKAAFCAKVASNQLQVSTGARSYCFGSQPNGKSAPAGAGASSQAPTPFTSNHNAANPLEDVAPYGTHAYGQSETSIAGYNQYGVEAWNDATGFFSPACSAMSKDELTGVGFTNNHGASWTDLGGLPNNSCSFSTWSGDPSVQPYQGPVPDAPSGQQPSGTTTYFYIASLISSSGGCVGAPRCDAPSAPGASPASACFGLCVGLEQAHVSGGSLVFSGTPIVLVDNPFGFNIEDKEFAAIDQARHRLYISYTDFQAGSGLGQIMLSVCDLTNPEVPDCQAPYMIVSAASGGCDEQEGAYPAVDPKTGDVYVAYEDNWATNLFGCFSPVQEVLQYIPFACLTLPSASCGPANSKSWNIVSMDGAFIPGYNRFPMNDFPRIAFTNAGGGIGAGGKVAIVWNDATYHANGDILFKLFTANTLLTNPGVGVVNDDHSGALHFLPAISTDGRGNFDVSWYDRRNGGQNSDKTDVYASLGVSASGVTFPANFKVTTVASNWLATNSDIVPNFGDYTDNFVGSNDTAPNPHRVWVAWSDGRTGIPQPENATTTVP